MLPRHQTRQLRAVLLCLQIQCRLPAVPPTLAKFLYPKPYVLYPRHMRINKYVALANGMSRREADTAIEQGRVSINGQPPTPGQQIREEDTVTLDSLPITTAVKTQTIILNKPVGYVVSRDGQGSKTIYDLLPKEFHNLKPVGRLDKDSSGLLLLTNDGKLAHELTHPSFQKEKVYEVVLDKLLADTDRHRIESGVTLEDGLSKLKLERKGMDSAYERGAQPPNPPHLQRSWLHRDQTTPHPVWQICFAIKP